MNSYVLSAIILSALITFLLRAFPFLLFKEKELPKWLEKLEKHLPMTIMAVLIVYCLKDLKTQLTTLFIPYLLACLTAFINLDQISLRYVFMILLSISLYFSISKALLVTLIKDF